MVGDIEDPRRVEPAYLLDDRAMLEGWLEFHRITLLLKCEGLDDAARKRRPVQTSLLSLHGLVRHMAEVERNWFRRVLLRDASDTVDLFKRRPRRQRACSRSTTPTGRPTSPPGTASATPAAGLLPHITWQTPALRRGEPVLPALDIHPHDRGIRPPQWPRRPHPGDGRRLRRLVGAVAGPALDGFLPSTGGRRLCRRRPRFARSAA